MKTLQRPWLREFLHSLGTSPLLTREDFIARYFPRYVEPYRLDHRIRINAKGRCTSPNGGTARGQETKRANIVDAAFSAYLSDFNSSYNHYAFHEDMR